MDTPLWINKPSILYEKQYLFEVLPSEGFDLNRKLNALFRLSIYYSIILMVLNRTKKWVLYVPLIMGIMSYLVNRYYRESQVKEKIGLMMNSDEETLEGLENDGEIDDILNTINGECRVPTKNNPFMNPIAGDGISEEDKKENCTSYNNKGIQREIDKQFNNGLFKDVNDIFGKNNSQRQFFSVPGGSIPNDQGSFAKWLYSTPPTCKEGNGLQCAANQYGVSGLRGSETSKAG